MWERLKRKTRKLATIQKVEAIRPIPDADRIELAQILGWEVVVKKGQFKPGDLCLFIEVDSLVPARIWLPFMLKDRNPNKIIKIRTKKMKGQISQGLAIPIKEVLFKMEGYELGDDLTEPLGIKKIEDKIPKSQNVMGRFPHPIPKTDEPRFQSVPELFQRFKKYQGDVYASLKIDGMSATYFYSREEFMVFSRNWRIADGNNPYWNIARKYKIEEKLRDRRNLVIQGEIYGPKIQGNRLGVDDIEFAVFNMLNFRIAAMHKKLFDMIEMRVFLKSINIPMVPVIYEGKFKWNSINEMLDYADTLEYPNGHRAEGFVVRTIQPQQYEKRILSGKIVSRDYLLKK